MHPGSLRAAEAARSGWPEDRAHLYAWWIPANQEVVMQGHVGIPARGPSTARGLSLGAWTAAAVSLLWRWHELASQRRALLALDERMLKDIGISRAEAEREASRPFWQGGFDRLDRQSSFGLDVT